MCKFVLFYSVEREYVGFVYVLLIFNGLWVLDVVCEMCFVVIFKLFERILISLVFEVE